MPRGGLAWLLPALWAALIFTLSSFPNFSGVPFVMRVSDKIWHVLAYMPLGFLIMYALNEQPGPFHRAPAVWAQLFGTLYAFSDEIHQAFVPGRFMDLLDAAADALGVFLGIWAFLLLQVLLPRLFGAPRSRQSPPS